MKRIIVILTIAVLITACNSGGFVSSLEKQYQNLESYTAQYSVHMNDAKFDVYEQYSEKGQHHIIEVVADTGYQQSIELEGEKVKLKNINDSKEIVGDRENFNYPIFVLVSIMDEIIAKKDTIKILDTQNIEINNGEILVTHNKNKLSKVILNMQNEQITIEYENLDIN